MRTGGAPSTDRTQALTYKSASVLLQYPDDRVHDHLDDVAAVVAGLPDAKQRLPLTELVGWLHATPPTDAAEHHVATFDLTRRCSPYLTYYRYGDTRQRGMALLALKRTYRESGFELGEAELPDYLPVVLEFAALAEGDAGRQLLGLHRPGLELLRLALRDAPSPYIAALDAVCAGLPALSDRQDADVRRLAAGGPPKEDVGLDPIGTEPFAPPEFLGAAGMGAPR